MFITNRSFIVVTFDRDFFCVYNKSHDIDSYDSKDSSKRKRVERCVTWDLESLTREPQGYFLFRLGQSGFAVADINRSHSRECLEGLMNVPPWPVDDLVVRAHDTNGLVCFGEESPSSCRVTMALHFFVSSRSFEFSFSISRFGTTLIRSIRENKDNAESEFSAYYLTINSYQLVGWLQQEGHERG